MIERVTVAVLCRPVRLLRNTLIAGTLLSSTAMIVTAGAQSDYPSRPVQLIVPYGAGGIADVGMRILADKLPGRLKQQFVVENRPGAGGIVAAKARCVGCSRWLYRVDDWQQQRHQRVPFQIAALQHSYGLRLDLNYFLL